MQPLANQERRQRADQQSDELQPLNAQAGSVGQPIHEIRPDSVGWIAIRVGLNVALDHGRSSSAGGRIETAGVAAHSVSPRSAGRNFRHSPNNRNYSSRFPTCLFLWRNTNADGRPACANSDPPNLKVGIDPPCLMPNSQKLVENLG